MNLKQLIAKHYKFHEVSKIVFFDEGNAYYDASATIHYKVFQNCKTDICFLGEYQIKKMLDESKEDISQALNEFNELFGKGIAC